METDRIVRENRDLVFTLCLQVLRHRQDAEDACQEALLKIARGMPEGVEAAAWIHRVALRTAIDHRRSRMRRRAREERVAAGTPRAAVEEAAPEILEVLAGLPDEDRTVLVEHFFARKTLKAMADARGVTEPAVWKRVEKGKERLRQALMATAPALAVAMDRVLEAVEPAAAPSRILPAVTAGKAGIVVAGLCLPVLLVAGLAARERTPETIPAEPAARTPADAGPRAASAAAVAPVREQVGPSSVPPYPWEMPPRAWSEPRRQAWRALNEGTLSFECTDAWLHEMLAELSDKAGVPIRLDPGVPVPPHRTSFKSRDLGLKSTLKLLLSRHGLDFTLRSDGTLWVSFLDRPAVETDPEAERIEAVRRRLDEALREMAAGKSGWPPADPLRPALERVVDVPPGRYELWKLLDILRRGSDVNMHIDDGHIWPSNPALREESRNILLRLQEAEDRKDHVEAARLMHEIRAFTRRAQVLEPREKTFDGGSRTLEAHLDAMSMTWPAGWAAKDGLIMVLAPEQAVEARAKARAEREALLSAAARLDPPVRSAPTTVHGLAEALPRETGIRLVPSESIWTAPLPPATGSWKELVDALPSAGFRWLYAEGTLYLTR